MSSPRPRSPRSPFSASDRSSTETILDKHSEKCEKCKLESERSLQLGVPLIALFRLANAIAGCVAVARIHQTVDAGWWVWEHKVLFSLCWVIFFWNLLVAGGSILGYAYWPTPRRTFGMPPITVTVNGYNLVSFGGPDEPDADRRRRMKRVQVSVFDMVLTIPTMVLLIWSKTGMDPWWGSRYIGLWPPTVTPIAVLIAFQFLVATVQLFEIFEARVIGIKLDMYDIYENEERLGRLRLRA
ncbi:uncharacterized protein B0I36DRAFT_333416 [Microdochium trichocladiopsis]|uniref:Uncharacterized protein n=1 Tax=Microdochium trichocladiopsis TaxID=1682393 RepID=A0A9P8XUY7_9PEZI|nr:uncharacterized protein B0I36DRAFT_333416 [Microdochium trichocladiopsis]KAH7020911.1 hypothetical protein B0I36DRAFT_333416 [Microdochium trichocladiopsis]